jgi:hypothetical protein
LKNGFALVPLIRRNNRLSSLVLTLFHFPNTLHPLGKLAEKQGRKVTGLREAMAAGLRHGSSSVCITHLPPMPIEKMDWRAK